jgi:hypothetical protein
LPCRPPDSLSVNPSNRRGPSHLRRRSTGVATYGDAANDPARTLSGLPRTVNAVYEISTNGRLPPKESHKLLLGTEGDIDERIMDGTLLRVVGRSPGKSDHRCRIEDGNLIEDEDG